MDLNPYRFQAGWEEMELARFAEKELVDMVICIMAWLRSPSSEPDPEEEGKQTEQMKWRECSSTISYWAARCEPMWKRECFFVACNRIGTEGGKLLGSFCFAQK